MLNQLLIRYCFGVLLVTCQLASGGTPEKPIPGWPDQRLIGPLLCHADFPLDAYVPFFEDIGNLQHELLTTLGVGHVQEYIHIYLFSKRSTYKKYLKQHLPTVPFRRALYVKGHGPGMVFAYTNGDFQTDLRHECTHALLHASLPMVPLWLDEGLAEYFELPAGKRKIGSPHMGAMRRNVRFGLYARIPALESISSIADMKVRDYRFAWAWVHFLLNGSHEGHDELRRFLADISSHQPPGQLSQRLASRLPELDRQFSRYFLN